MARIEWVEQRLRAWAAAVTVGDGSGFPVMSVLHPNWSPPSPGTTPTLKSCGGQRGVMATHRLLSLLSARERNTVAVVYCLRLSVADQAERLGCQPDTVHARVEAIHRTLARWFDESTKVDAVGID